MTLLNGSIFVYGTSSVIVRGGTNAHNTIVAANTVPQTVKSFFKVNGKELTAHNRQFNATNNFITKDQVLASGNRRRCLVRNPQAFSLSFKYLPGPSGMTVDGQAGRDYMYTLANLGQNVTVEYLPDYTSDQDDFSYISLRGRIKSYSETLLRRDEIGGCYYYNVNISFEEL